MSEGFNHFSRLADALPGVLSKVVRKTAFEAQGNIQARIRTNGQIDTGFMLNSGYVVTSDNSTYTGGEKALPEIGKPDSPTTAYVAWGASYSAYQELGTRFLPARPFFFPGVEDTRPGFEEVCRRIEQMLKQEAGL